VSDLTTTDSAEPITDPRAGREAVTEILRRRWLGPFDGESEALVRNPVYSYLIGTLYPVEKGTPSGPAVGDPETDAVDDADVAVEPGGLVESDGTEESDDEDTGINITGAFGWAPQSMGVSFVHSSDVIAVDVSAGVYVKVAAETASKADTPAEDTGKPDEVWQRVPLADRVMIDVAASGRVSALEGRAHVSWRSRHHAGKRLTTVSVSNAESVAPGEAKRYPDLCLFQVSLTCTDASGLHPYPQSDVFASPEDRELSFRYRDKPAFAIGHGVAVEWHPRDAPTTVTTDVMPVADVPAIRARSGDGDVFAMAWLAREDLSGNAYADALGAVIDGYRAWVAEQRLEAGAVDHAHVDVAQSIIDRQERAVSRIEGGIELLRRDAGILEAFRLANRAMRWQMLRQNGDVDPATRFGSVLDADRGKDEPRWRPFQLAFILSALASTVDDEHDDRGIVDLIWFPTGGGKTEAYLGLAAVEMIRRRIQRGHRGGGTAVLTRYTMRLLTAQQFQRAATLICALELMRSDDERFDESPAFSIGLWLGNSTTPGTYKQAHDQLRRVMKQSRPENPFQLLSCPWCGHALMPERHTAHGEKYGVRTSSRSLEFFCPDEDCPFHDALPVQVVDEGLYENPPTMLVATVDKLARLAWVSQGGKMFGAGTICDPPSLVIQDELHLLSGPLGTIVGVYEAAIEGLLAWHGAAPKIVASTATTRASERQVRELMAKDVESFPPSGLDADDNYFAEPDLEAPGRRYIGVMPQAHTPSWAVGQLSAEMLDAPRSTRGRGEECLLDARRLPQQPARTGAHCDHPARRRPVQPRTPNSGRRRRTRTRVGRRP